MPHWKTLTEQKYIGAWSLEDGEDLIVTIKDIKQELITGENGRTEKKGVCYFEGDVLPMIMNATNFSTLETLFRTGDYTKWIGKKIQLYKTQVNAFGKNMMALRIRDFEPKG